VTRLLPVLVGSALLLASACATSDSKPDGPPAAAGTLVEGSVSVAEGATAPASMKVIALWVVTATSPDYAYKFGEAPVKDGKFQLTVDGAKLPQDALNTLGEFRLGVAMIAVVPGDAAIPDGRFDGNPDEMMLGNATDNALIFRRAVGPPKLKWPEAFGEGTVQCGKGAPPPEGARFHIFVPTACKGIDVKVGGPKKWVNWT